MSLLCNEFNNFNLEGVTIPFTLGLILYPTSTSNQVIAQEPTGSNNLDFYIWNNHFNLYNDGSVDVYTDLSVSANNWYFVGYSVDSDLRSCRMFASLLGSNSIEFVTASSGADLGASEFEFSRTGIFFSGNYGGIKYWDSALSNAQIQQEAHQLRCLTNPTSWIPMTDYTSLAGQGRNLRGNGQSLTMVDSPTISTISPPVPLGVPLVPYVPQLVAPPPPTYFASPLGMLTAC